VLTFWKLQARAAHSALPPLLEMKHSTYSMTRKQRDEARHGGTQTHLPQTNLMHSLQKQKTMLTAFFKYRSVLHKEFVP